MDSSNRDDLTLGSRSVRDAEEERGDVDSPVKESCWSQREALPGEPRCVICGRYGEYICDETDDDICSMECKNRLLENLSRTRKPPPSRIHLEKLPASGIFYSSFKLPQKLLENLKSVGYEIPTPVQTKVIPAVLDGKNLLVSSETGSGKTASFLVPIVARCSEIRMKHPESEKKPLALILEPTRELCVQVEEQAKLLGKGLPFKFRSKSLVIDVNLSHLRCTSNIKSEKEPSS